MANRSKRELYERVIDAVRSAGWAVTRLSGEREHPLRFDMERDGEAHRVRAYIWNTTHGGGEERPEKERRIQITGIGTFEPEPDGVTAILGWNAETATFAAFDIGHHLGTLGKSPSVQIGAEALNEASEKGAAIHRKRKGEIAIALRPDLLASYIANAASAHAGDLSAFLDDGEAIRRTDFGKLADQSLPELIGGDAELAERRRLRERLDALREELDAMERGPATIGHNRPPEPIAENGDAEAAAVHDAAAALSDAVGEEPPDPHAVARQADRLQRSAVEARGFITKIVETGRDKAADAVVGVIAAGAVMLGREALELIWATLHQIEAWFAVIGG